MSTVPIQKFNQRSVDLPKVFAIAGATGIGKTAWIRHQIAKISEPVVYFCLLTMLRSIPLFGQGK